MKNDRIRKNSVLIDNGQMIRVLELKEDQALVIDCQKRTMPFWMPLEELEKLSEGTWEAEERELGAEEKRIMHQRFTMITGILPVIGEKGKRGEAICLASEEFKVSKQTIRKYLCLYLAYQNIEALAPKPFPKEEKGKELTMDEKNMRWALNKFFYTTAKNSLRTAYRLLLSHRYCDGEGKLLKSYPSFYQFRYFYRKTRKMQNYYISREGLKDYQKNHRPLLGDGVQEYAKGIGTGMLDATVCDLYLVDESGNVVGRPILTACVDAYTSLCCGYSLSWEGGIYSLRNLMVNVVSDKVEHCRKFGITISEGDWPCQSLPGRLVTDMGTEYTSDTFGQLTELGITITNLPAYRPELKGPVERFFQTIQDCYKPYLKGKGVIEPNYRERGAHDYKKDACLTIEDFEKIILHCIIFYNSQRLLEHFQYTQEMLEIGMKPYASDLWRYSSGRPEDDLIQATKEQIILCLLPRTTGKFARNGLRVNKMRYSHPNYVEKYLNGESATVAYNPDDVSYVWLIENGNYVRFELIEARFEGKRLEEAETIRKGQSQLLSAFQEERVQAEIDLTRYIQAIANRGSGLADGKVKNIRTNRQKEQGRKHIDLARGLTEDLGKEAVGRGTA